MALGPPWRPTLREEPTTSEPQFGLSSPRASGVLLHPTSLGARPRVADALRLLDWLEAAGQRWWQVLPLGPPDRFRSPYAARSAFAANPNLFADDGGRVTTADVDEFRASHPYWSCGWARYGGRDALAAQVRFERAWSTVRAHAAERNIRILGDLPFYVARDSADPVAHPELFDDAHEAGVPPDQWSATGQLWGSPIYDWPAMRAEGFAWWIERIRRTLELVDAVRFDHFRGLVAYWSVPRGAATAMEGAWRRTPGRELLCAIADALGPVPIVAENLGVITPPVEALRERFGMPGTVVMQFYFGHDPRSPRADDDENNVVYTGTHDNDTAVGWWQDATDGERARVDRFLAAAGATHTEPHWKLIAAALHHRARVAIVPAQDVLGLDGRARLNRPGRRSGNWSWRLERGQLTPALARRLRASTIDAGRAAP